MANTSHSVIRYTFTNSITRCNNKQWGCFNQAYHIYLCWKMLIATLSEEHSAYILTLPHTNAIIISLLSHYPARKWDGKQKPSNKGNKSSFDKTNMALTIKSLAQAWTESSWIISLVPIWVSKNFFFTTCGYRARATSTKCNISIESSGKGLILPFRTGQMQSWNDCSSIWNKRSVVLYYELFSLSDDIKNPKA